MNFEFITMKDPHFSFGFQNRIRTSYEKHILQKLDFVKDYCAKDEVENLIFTGDVFDSSAEDKWSFKKYRKNKRVLEQFSKQGINLYSNVGNHDMFHGWEESNDTIFGEMVHDGILNNITTNPIVITEEGVPAIIKIQGVDYSNEDNVILENIRTFDEEQYPGYQMFKVAVLHSNVTPDTVSYVTDFTYKALADQFPDIDMFILGHYHVGYDTTIYDRPDNGKPCYFVNNWNFTRVVRDYETELDEHVPEFEHINIMYDKITGTFGATCVTIPVPFIPYKNAFISKAIDLLKKSKNDIFNFFENIDIEEVKQNSKSSDDELIEKIAEKSKYSDEAHSLAVQYLNDAKK